MKLFVTGGAGFIGSHVVQQAIKHGHSVTVFDNLSMGYAAFVDPQAQFVRGDLSSSDELVKAMAGHEVVIHLAATSIISHTLRDPRQAYANNVTNGINLLEAMRQTGVDLIINSSTAAVYGEPERIPINENDPTRPVTPYGASKRAFEHALQAYHASYGIRSVSLRYFNAYGPRDEQQPVTRAVPKWIKAALRGEPIEVYWQGEQYRDYVYVRDIAEAHLRVLNLRGCQVFNVGSANGVFMKDVIELISELTNRPLQVRDLGERPGDPSRLTADVSHLCDTIGWKPATTLPQGLRRTIAYFERSLQHGPHYADEDGA
jgi:UDP-glucose 4-epimerase